MSNGRELFPCGTLGGPPPSARRQTELGAARSGPCPEGSTLTRLELGIAPAVAVHAMDRHVTGPRSLRGRSNEATRHGNCLATGDLRHSPAVMQRPRTSTTFSHFGTSRSTTLSTFVLSASLDATLVTRDSECQESEGVAPASPFGLEHTSGTHSCDRSPCGASLR